MWKWLSNSVASCVEFIGDVLCPHDDEIQRLSAMWRESLHQRDKLVIELDAMTKERDGLKEAESNLKAEIESRSEYIIESSKEHESVAIENKELQKQLADSLDNARCWEESFNLVRQALDASPLDNDDVIVVKTKGNMNEVYFKEIFSGVKARVIIVNEDCVDVAIARFDSESKVKVN